MKPFAALRFCEVSNKICIIFSKKIFLMNSNDINTRKTFEQLIEFPAPGSAAESEIFMQLQRGFIDQYEKIFPDKLAPRTIAILPSLTLDEDILSKITGSVHYEERMLCLLMLLRMPQTKVIYITSMPIADSIIDYYLHLLPGITGRHARKRLTMISCYDATVKPLTQKVLERPRIMERIRQLINDKKSAHLTCFNITPLEKTLAVQLGIPLFGTDPDKSYEGTKSGSRKTFRLSGVDFPDGFEDLHSREDVIRSLSSLRKKYPALRKAVVKLNDGFSGDGNAIFTYPQNLIDDQLEDQISKNLSAHLKMVAHDITETIYFEKMKQMGGIVEEFLEGEIKMSPSVQCVIGPNKVIDIVSTHDQLLGGDDNQVYQGAIFPANEQYSITLAKEGKKIAKILADKGALGRFAIDFISVQQEDGKWKHHAIEINLRKGGTTHPLLMLQFLTDGKYNADTGEYLTASRHKRFYFASDNVYNEKYKGITPDDLIDISIFHNLMYDGATQEGVMFHLIGALSEHGKFGLLCVGSSHEKAKAFYDKTIQIMDMECSNPV
jgi:PGM1 C-terminal domain